MKIAKTAARRTIKVPARAAAQSHVTLAEARRTTRELTAAPKPRRAKEAFMKPMTPSSTLAAVVGASPMPRTEVTSRLWGYIKKNNLQDKSNRRMINADEKLRPVFGKSRVSRSQVSALIGKSLKK